MLQDLIGKPPTKSGSGGEKYWVGLLTEAGELPIARMPLAPLVCFLLPRGAEPGALSFVGIYRTPSGNTMESLYEMPFENPRINPGHYISLTLYTDKKNG